MKLETLAVHTGHEIDPGTRAVSPPIVLSSTFEREPNYAHDGHIYSRSSNPNRDALEKALAMLEGGQMAAAFASGQAATMSVLHALNPGDHVIMPDELYFASRGLLDAHYARWGLQASYVDTADVSAVRAAIRPNTKLLWIETPSNPGLRVADIAALAELAHAHGAVCACDNTWATPLFQQPLALGADVVTHSTTKFIGGHSDVLGGCVVSKDAASEMAQRIRGYQQMGGAVPSPFDCWLLLRSIPSMPVRVRAQCASAKKIAGWLMGHPRVEVVRYPGLPTHAQHAIAQKQMSDFGAMLSFEVKGGAQAALAVAAKARVFIRATSLGGFESLIEHRASVEGPATRTPQGLLRCSIGLEHGDDLIEDLRQALE
ncbi:MAG TPA: PLP-dependent aspartate aminotransferase family protein [Thermoflexales bacterium]|nr:PLP-dependent aspartate aminotransferase family protein [Thermoflexales bacterium]